jgi:hypothetical protein
MRAATLFTTVVVVSASLALSSTASASEPASPLAELLHEGHEILGELEIATFVTRDHEGVLASDVTVRDMASGDELDVWTEGETVWWDGTADGVPSHGSIPAPDGGGGAPAGGDSDDDDEGGGN